MVEIPIQNLYYLLCYAWDKLAEKDIVDVQPIDRTSLAGLFAKVLINGTHHLVKRGFDRGYVTERAWTGQLKGRLCLQEAVSRGLPRTGTFPCEFDELSHDVLHNQILKATIGKLKGMPGLAPEVVGGLEQLRRLLSDVRAIDLSARVFGQIQLHRNNQFYDFLLKVCELVYRNLLPAEESGASKFRDFVRDEHQMRALFESFVRNFYRIETAYLVRREDINWRWLAADEMAQGLLPKMQTDISLTSATRKIIIDCKFTPQATQRHYDAEKLRSSHLFQIHAYLNNLADGPLADECEAILLYPAVDLPLSASYMQRKHKISIKTINLNQPWPAIHRDLLALVA